MSTPTTGTYGSTCQLVELQDLLGISGTEDNGVETATAFFVIKWSGNATTEDCRGCSDGTNVVPSRGSPHPQNSALYADRVEIRPLDNNCRNKFQARIEYSDDSDGVTNPLDAPPVIEWDIGEDGQVPYFIDNDPAGAKPCVNKAGERFSDFLQRYGGTVTATFAKNIPATGSGSWNPSQAISYCTPTPAVNSDSFTFDSFTITAGQARARGCTCGDVQKQNGVSYRVKKWSLAFKANWIDHVDNRGFNGIKIIDGYNKLAEIIKGTPPTKPDSPWPLFDNGVAAPNVDYVPTVLQFYPYPQMAFATLGFS